MAKSESELYIYRAVRSMRVPGKTHSDIQGTPVPTENIPFRTGHLEPFCAVIVADDFNRESPEWPRFTQVSPIHKRSYEIEGRMFIEDKYGNKFVTFTNKGGDGRDPRILKSDIAPSGIVIVGLQDSDSMVRVLKASDMLRAEHVDTEMIFEVMEPEKLPFDGELVDLVEFKRRLLQKVWDEDIKRHAKYKDTMFKTVTRKDIPNFAQALDNMTFFITTRAHLVSERLTDYRMAKNKEEFKVILERVLQAHNWQQMQNKEDGRIDEADIFDANDKESVYRFFTEYMPRKAARNLVRMHKLRLVHRFLHSGNVSALGGLYDLDSVKGAPLGDEEITDLNIAYDIGELVSAVAGCAGILASKGFMKRKNGLKPADIEMEAAGNFFDQFFGESGVDKEPLKHVGVMHELVQMFSQETSMILLNYYTKRISKEIDWDFEYQGSIEDLLDAFFETDKKYMEAPPSEDASTDSNSHPNSLLRFYNFTRARIIEKIRDDHKDVLDGKIGEDATINVALIFSMRETEKMLKQRHEKYGQWKKEDDAEMNQRLKMLEGYMMVNYFRNKGKEKNLPAHIKEIAAAFVYFKDEDSSRFLMYYTAKLSKYLGRDFIIPEDALPQIAEYFHDADEQKLRERIEKELQENPEKGAEDVIDEIVLHDQMDIEACARDRFGNFLVTYLHDGLAEIAGSKFEKIASKYGQETVDLIMSLFELREIRKMQGRQTHQEYDLVVGRFKKRIDTLKKEYSKAA